MTREKLIQLLATARHPEDVFGANLLDPARFFRAYARLVHPDVAPGDKKAEEAFKILNEFKEQAERKIDAGTYGDRTVIGKPIVLKTRKNVYTVTELIAHGDICQVYGGSSESGQRVAVKVTRSPANNDLTLNEGTQLSALWTNKEAAKMPVMKHIPKIIDSFTLQQGKVSKQVVILDRIDGYVSLLDVIKAYPKGLPLADAAWMFNRLLAALIAAHQCGVVHGAVLPRHVLIRPDNPTGDKDKNSHMGVLIDWSYSTKVGEKLKAIVPEDKPFYPAEVFNKKPTSFGTDTYMAAKVLSALLTGDASSQKLPEMPRNVLGLLRACWLAQERRSSDAFELFEDFKNALQDNFGKPKFRVFTMPKSAAS